jgi:hypothetical protein
LRWAIGLLASAALLSGGARSTAEPAPPLGKDALRLESLVAQGCAPYLLGRKSEVEAMRGVALNHIHPLPLGLMPGDDAPYWTSGLPGTLRVNVGAGICNIVLHGRDAAAYRAAAQRAVDLALGPGGPDERQSEYRQWLPGQVTGCRRDVRYSYYEDERRGRFSVELTRVACEHDPMRGAS